MRIEDHKDRRRLVGSDHGRELQKQYLRAHFLGQVAALLPKEEESSGRILSGSGKHEKKILLLNWRRAVLARVGRQTLQVLLNQIGRSVQVWDNLDSYAIHQAAEWIAGDCDVGVWTRHLQTVILAVQEVSSKWLQLWILRHQIRASLRSKGSPPVGAYIGVLFWASWLLNWRVNQLVFGLKVKWSRALIESTEEWARRVRTH